MTLRRKLILAFSIMIVPLLVVGGLTLWNTREENQALRALEEGLGRVRIFAELESAVHRQVLKIRDYLTGWDKGAKREFDWLDRVVRELAEEWKGAVSHPEDVQLAEDFDHLYREIKDLAEKAFTAYDGGRRDEAIRLVQQELDGRLFPDLDRKIKAIYRSSRAHNVKSALDRLEAIQGFTKMVLIVSVLSSVVLVALSSILISRNLARPVEELKRAMDIVGAGRLDAAIEVRSRDEIGDLARSFTDMTQKLKETQDQLIQSEKLASLGQMAAAVAHGLRNPLASIRAATQLSLRRVPREDPLREQLGSVIGEVDRLEKRITHLLDFTKPSPYRPVTEKPERLFQDVLPTFSEKFTEQEIRLRVDYAGDLPEVWVDPFQIELALLEVISNAVEAMPKGGMLTITACRCWQRGPTTGDTEVEITIVDTGGGIPEDARTHVFEPFFTTKADGTGLGLAIAKRLVEQNKGTLTIASMVGQGTSVRITLPIAS